MAVWYSSRCADRDLNRSGAYLWLPACRQTILICISLLSKEISNSESKSDCLMMHYYKAYNPYSTDIKRKRSKLTKAKYHKYLSTYTYQKHQHYSKVTVLRQDQLWPFIVYSIRILYGIDAKMIWLVSTSEMRCQQHSTLLSPSAASGDETSVFLELPGFFSACRR